MERARGTAVPLRTLDGLPVPIRIRGQMTWNELSWSLRIAARHSLRLSAPV